MVTAIIGIIIGALVLLAGLYYLVKEKRDPESKTIYGIIAAAGAVIAVVSAVILITRL